MCNDVLEKGLPESKTIGYSSYYGRRGIIWSLTNENDVVYLSHYGTIILEHHLKTNQFLVVGGFSSTDQRAINDYLTYVGYYPSLFCKRHNDNLKLVIN